MLIGVVNAAIWLGKIPQEGRSLLGRVGSGGGFRGRLFGRRGDAEAHEEETKAFAEGIDKTHGATFPETLLEYRVEKGQRRKLTRIALRPRLSGPRNAIDLLRLAGGRGGGWGPRRAGRVRG